MDTVTLTIDGQQITVPKGKTVLQAAIEAGKNADLVLWSGTPFSVYAHAEKVWIDGVLRFDRAAPDTRWRTDFELGFVPAGGR